MNLRALSLLLMLLPAVVLGNNGMELGISMPYSRSAVPGRPIFNLSWFSGRLSPFPGYTEYGFVAMLPLGGDDLPGPEAPRITDFAGMYAGQLFLPFHGWVRPGFSLGWIWEGKSQLTGQGDIRSHRSLSLYYAFKVQFSCLSFIGSNKGIGGGFNFSI